MNKKFIVRFIDDPCGLVTPAVKLHTDPGFVGSTLFDTEEEAYDAGRKSKYMTKEFGGMYLVIIPVCVPWGRGDD